MLCEGVVHSSQPDKADETIAGVKEAFPEVKTVKLSLGAVIGCHGGPDLIGLVFSDKYNFEDYED